MSPTPQYAKKKAKLNLPNPQSDSLEDGQPLWQKSKLDSNQSSSCSSISSKVEKIPKKIVYGVDFNPKEVEMTDLNDSDDET